MGPIAKAFRGIGFILFGTLLLGTGDAVAEAEVDCLACHGDLTAGKKAHTAVSLGCTTCHVAVDATEIPHRITNSVKRGLTAEPPRLCHTCHDKSAFELKHVHPALEMGCPTCHNPHASEQPNLLTAPVPELCTGCHDRAVFTKKFQHGPVAAGLCTQCHSPHASRYASLLTRPPVQLCGACHAATLIDRHLISGKEGKGHPLGADDGPGRRKVKDPFRKGRRFCCVSCHDPHSSDAHYMVRFPMETPLDICKNCHASRF